MTPPRIRGLVDRLDRAVRLHMYASAQAKPEAKDAVLKAKMDILRAFAVVSGPAVEQPSEPECDWHSGEFSNCRHAPEPGKRYCANHSQWEDTK